MKNRLQLYRNSAVLFMAVCAAQAMIVQRMYKKLEPGQNITGEVVAVPGVRSPSECAFIERKYFLIRLHGTNIGEKQTLVSDAAGVIYIANYAWNNTIVNESPLGSWNGPPAALYFDFDTLTGLGLMAGSGASIYDALVPGKINKALAWTDPSLNQWVDLGVLSEACITVPDTCGPEGAAISLWVKIHNCGNGDGILSSLKSWNSEKSGFMFFCHPSCIRNYVKVKTGSFWADVPKTNDLWIHLVLNFIGPNSGEGIQAFKDGTLQERDLYDYSGTYTDGEGRVVIGRKYVSISQDYAHVEVDELIFFNQALLEEEVNELYNMYK